MHKLQLNKIHHQTQNQCLKENQNQRRNMVNDECEVAFFTRKK